VLHEARRQLTDGTPGSSYPQQLTPSKGIPGMSTDAAGPTFALAGAAGYIARRHMEAIRDVGGTLTACYDIADSVGILDSYFPGARFFTYGREFEDYLSYHRPDYLVVCTPNDLHEAHAALGVRLCCDVIVEKPAALSGDGIDGLAALQAQTGRLIHPVLQMRYHGGLLQFRDLMRHRDPRHPARVTVRYVTRRGPWFAASWKGDPRRSGTVVFNVGIHLFDALAWALGPDPDILSASIDPAGDHAEGRLRFARATVDWTLSTRASDLPDGTASHAARQVWVDGEPACDFSGSTGLHVVMYQEITAGRGHRIEDARDDVRLAEQVRRAATQGVPGVPAPGQATSGRLASR
jgi:UDP-N-acetyl-2-amino-2-deoxyglucuronate dehydrogenase